MRDTVGTTTVCYCRVSSTKQRDDLDRQVAYMQSIYPNAEIVRDIGSGLNFKRKGL
ncbi:MAG: recombinase family protein, partial [Planktothrix sp.]